MSALKKIFGNWWVLSIGAAVLAALALALLLPMALSWFRPLWVRLALVGLVVLIWGGLTAWRMISAKRANDRLAKAVAAVPAEDAEGKALAERMQKAMAGLKAASGKQRNYLYSRPWYVIIGPPGAGKSTALINSGLRFPFSETALKGSGGTRNLDFWFADEAVLVDTAGRYTSQDSDAERDRKAWDSFLALLKKNRPLQPINGVMIAIGLDELANADVAKVDRHASTVRRRLAELREALEVEVPVYVLFTKADLIAGFSEFFEDLDVEGRRSVLGSTLPWGEGARPNTEAFTRAFDDMAQAISDRTSKRLQEDMDARRRGLIVGFPAQVQAVRSRIVRFLDGAFPADAPEGAAAVRGFYLTSGVQQGSAIDRVLGSVASLYDAPVRPSAQQGGRAYFINRLLKDVMFPEAGLVASSKKARARRAAMLTGGLAAVGLVSAVVLAAWMVSFFANRGFQGDLLTGSNNMVQEIRANGIDLTEVSEQDPDLEAALSVLNNLRDLPGGYAESRKGRPITMGFGLFQSGHAKAAEQAYREGLQRILLPRVLLRLERFLQDNQTDALATYEPLKVYLMLGGQGPMDRKAVKAWVVNDWEENVFPGMDRQRVRADLTGHLEVLLADRQLGSVWPNRRAPLDDGLIQSARAGIQALSMADRAYAVLRQQAAASGKPDWAASSVMSAGHARAFANGDAVLSQTVPFFFTKTGFEQQYQIGLQNVQRELEKDLWVLGGEQDKEAVRQQMSGLKPGVAGLYAQDYIKAWEAVVNSLQPANYFADPVAASAATSPPSPFKLVLLEVRKNTRFGGGTAMGAAADAATRRATSRMPVSAGTFVQERTRQATGLDASRQIEQAFVDVHEYVGDGKAPAPIDEFFAKLRAATTAKAAADAAAQSGLGAEAQQVTLQQAMAELQAAAATAPPVAQAFTSPAAQQGGQAQVAAATGAVMGDYDRQVGPACRSVTDNRYPFVAVSQSDAPVGDLLRVFGPNGAIDGYVQSRLMPLMETFGPTWRWKADSPVTAAYDPTSAGQFQRAAEIRDLLTSGAPFKVEAMGFGGAVTAAELSVGGQTVKLEPSVPGARQLQWNVSSLPEAKLTLIEKDKPGKTYSFEGPWAPFRLFDAARKENAGPTAFKATFGEGASYVTLRVSLPSEKNPFSRGGLWSFRCPPRL
jgi:type VI secretion system protein ImpL